MEKKQRSLRQVAFQVFYELSSDIIMRTPVDTGYARGSWAAGINKTSLNWSGAPDRGGRSTLGKVSSSTKSFQLGDTLYLGSNLEYMSVLEYGQYGTGAYATSKTTRDGFSVQSPYGMVRVAIDNFGKNLEKAIKDEQ